MEAVLEEARRFFCAVGRPRASGEVATDAVLVPLPPRIASPASTGRHSRMGCGEVIRWQAGEGWGRTLQAGGRSEGASPQQAKNEGGDPWASQRRHATGAWGKRSGSADRGTTTTACRDLRPYSRKAIGRPEYRLISTSPNQVEQRQGAQTPGATSMADTPGFWTAIGQA